MFIGLTNFFDQSGPAAYFRHGNSLKYANVHDDNSINAHFCWQTRICSRRDFHKLTFCYTDGLFQKKKACLSICFLRKKFFPVIFDFHFRENPYFRDEFQALLYTQFFLKSAHMLITAFIWLMNIQSHISPRYLNSLTTPQICRFWCPNPAKALWGLHTAVQNRWRAHA